MRRNWFSDFWKECSWVEKVVVTSLVIGIVLFIALSIVAYKEQDTIPATTQDYEPLIAKQHALEGNKELAFEELLKENWSIEDNTGQSISIRFENDECYIITKYDKEEFMIISNSSYDKAMSKSETLGASMFAGFVLGLLGGFVVFVALCLIVWIWKKIHNYIVAKPKKVR